MVQLIDSLPIVARALCDTGSQVNLITEQIIQQTQLHHNKHETIIYGIGGGAAAVSKGKVNLRIASLINPNFSLQIEALVLPKITNTLLPNINIVNIRNSHLAHLPLADPNYGRPGKIDLLLGADTYGRLITNGFIHGRENELHAQNTQLGWVVFGTIMASDIQTRTISMAQDEALMRLDSALRRFWEQEEYLNEAPTHYTLEEKLALDIFAETHYRYPNGRFCVQYPFSPDAQVLGDSYWLAKTHFLQLERRLQRDIELKGKYIQFMQEYIDLGYMQLAKMHENPTQVYYIPHHPVTAKFRVVYNASAKTTNGSSLNDTLLNGPIRQEPLINILWRFRQYKNAIVADIAGMFLCVAVHPKHIDWQRIIWRPDPSLPLKVYNLLRVPFGTKSGPFNAVESLRECALDFPSWMVSHLQEQMNENEMMVAIEAILQDFYMDDFLKSIDDAQMAVTLVNNIITILQTGQFHLRKWNSNNEDILLAINTNDISIDANLPLHRSDTTVLGLILQTGNDKLSFSVQLDKLKHPKTKRAILSELATIYDPIGLISPILITGKIFIQKLWQLEGIDWDTVLPKLQLQEWQRYRLSLHQINEISVERWLGFSSMAETILHGFCDASKRLCAINCLQNKGNVAKGRKYST